MRHQAMNHYRAGNLEKAEPLFLQCLDQHPHDVDILHVLGLIRIRKGDNEKAVTLMRAALANGGDKSALYANLAVAYQNLGRNGEAITAGKQALELDHHSVFALNVMGNAYASLGDYETAKEHLVQAIRLRPDVAETRVNLGDVYAMLGMHAEAAGEYRRAMAVKQDHPEVLRKLGKALSGAGDAEGAVEVLMRAQTIDSGSAEGYVILGDSLLEMRYHDAAIESYRQAIQLNKYLEHAYCGMGKAFLAKEQFADAASSYETALEVNPFIAEACIGLGNVMRESGHHQKAVEAYEKALGLKPDVSDIYYNISNVYFDAGLLDEAETNCRKALSLEPDLVGGHWNMAWALLARGDFLRGWQEYSWRLRKKGAKKRRYPFPSWDGSSLRGRSILVLTEQGVGDEIMFASCLSEIISEAELCIVECDQRLVPLFSRSFPQAVFIPRFGEGGTDAPLPHIDCQVEIGSLPMYLRSDISRFPERQSYLVADSTGMNRWRERYRNLQNDINVGISWTGGADLAKRRRTIPLDLWMSIFAVRRVNFINLQYGDHTAELRLLQQASAVQIHHWQDSDPLKNMDDFASQVSSLDLVISADNSTVHLAGALGVPVWVMLPLSSEWRWMREVQDTPWYRCMRLFRQTSFGDWSDVIHDIASALELLVSSGAVPEVKKTYKDLGSTGQIPSRSKDGNNRG